MAVMKNLWGWAFLLVLLLNPPLGMLWALLYIAYAIGDIKGTCVAMKKD